MNWAVQGGHLNCGSIFLSYVFAFYRSLTKTTTLPASVLTTFEQAIRGPSHHSLVPGLPSVYASMAEALAVVGIVSSIAQLVEFSSKILSRLHDFQSAVTDIPKTFQQIKAELPLLRDTLQQTKEAIDAGRVNDETTKALDPIIQGCREQIELLDATLAKTLPSPNDTPGKRRIKAILSIPQDAKVEKIVKTLHSYIRTLTFYYAAVSSTLRPLTGKYSPSTKDYIYANPCR